MFVPVREREKERERGRERDVIATWSSFSLSLKILKSRTDKKLENSLTMFAQRKKNEKS